MEPISRHRRRYRPGRSTSGMGSAPSTWNPLDDAVVGRRERPYRCPPYSGGSGVANRRPL